MAALPLRAVQITPGPAGVQTARAALTARWNDGGPPFALIPAPSRHVSEEYATRVLACVRADDPVENDDAALVIATSGSTGDPRGVVLTTDNLRAAAEASWERLPGLRDCTWVLALPVTSVGGLAVLARAHLSGQDVHALPSVGGAGRFTVDELLDVRTEQPFAISLVPTQLSDILESPAATQWLTQAHAVLVGAASTPHSLEARARESGIELVTTYGMTETSGGCVYDGIPLPGVEIDLDTDGRVSVTGRQVASGYRDAGPGADSNFSGGDAPARRVGQDVPVGQRRFRTSDLGMWDQGRLRILGRADDVVTVHGVNVALGAVESLVRADPSVRDATVIAVPDARQGHRIVAFIVGAGSAPVTDIASLVAERIGGAARPEVLQVDSLPLLPSGKIDRLALGAIAQGD